MLTITNINKILNTTLKYNDKKIYNMIEHFYNENEIFDKSSLVICLIYLKRYIESCKYTPKNIEDIIETSLSYQINFFLT